MELVSCLAYLTCTKILTIEVQDEDLVGSPTVCSLPWDRSRKPMGMAVGEKD